MDLNLNLGLPLCPPPLSVDLGYDSALEDLAFPSLEIDNVLTQLPSIDAFDTVDDNLYEPFELPAYSGIPPAPFEERRADVNALNSMPHSASLILGDEPLARTGGPASRRELLDPEHRFQRLFESRHRFDMARTRSSPEEFGHRTHPATDPERLMRDIRRSGRLVGSVGKHKTNDKAAQVETSAEEKKERNNGASDFDCNICFEVAKEPVVTCCGHLFCWPCLYQWLHVHCDYKECPVCKGKVNESSVVPIYGRGSSDVSGVRKNAEDGDQVLKIPPRPQGNRVESLRQQLQGPFLARPEAWIMREVQHLFSDLPEGFRWQHLFNELPESFRLLRREDRRNPPTTARIVSPAPTVAATPPLQTGPTSHQQNFVQSSAPLPPIGAAGPRSTSRRRMRPVTITVSDDLPDPAPSPSQASTSSTMATIQGETGGTSMVLRRRTRSRTSGSSDANESVPRQRRRLN